MPKKPTITRGADFSLPVQITSEPYAEGLLIQSSSTANPCVIECQLPHQLATNDRVRISGHRKNTIVNGRQTVTVVDSFKFSVPVAGIVTGEVTGRVSKAVNVTGYTITAKVLRQSGGTEIVGAPPVVAVTTAADGLLLVSLTKLQTPSIVANSCTVEITYVDTDSKTHKIGIECEVKNA